MRMAMITRPTEASEPMAPVRDDAALGHTEDLDRAPDGVPHVVVALGAITAIATALGAFAALAEHHTVTGLALIAIGVLLLVTRARSRRDRARAHPSR